MVGVIVGDTDEVTVLEGLIDEVELDEIVVVCELLGLIVAVPVGVCVIVPVEVLVGVCVEVGVTVGLIVIVLV